VVEIVARMKDKGIKELNSFKRRAMQLAALQRISKADADWLVERVNEIERKVTTMHEKPELERKYL
jgi:hypothetical protein